MSTQRSTRRRGVRAEVPVTQEAIVDAAFRLIEEKGASGFSMRAVASELGVFPATLYWHVGDRARLLGLVEQQWVSVVQMPDEISNPREWLMEVGRRYRRQAHLHPNVARMVVVERARNTEALANPEALEQFQGRPCLVSGRRLEPVEEEGIAAPGEHLKERAGQVNAEDIRIAMPVEALIERCGFHADGLFVMDGSRRSSHGNAYFTGFGKTKRIVFFDTLLERLEPREVEAVLAHELGHFRLRHLVKRLAMMSLISLGALALLGWLSERPWFYEGLGTSPDGITRNACALVLFMLVMPVFGFLFAPVASWLSRRDEFAADAWAASITGAQPLVDALLKLYQDNASTLTPDPVHSAFYDSHPPATLRIARLQGSAG